MKDSAMHVAAIHMFAGHSSRASLSSEDSTIYIQVGIQYSLKDKLRNTQPTTVNVVPRTKFPSE